MVLRRFNEFFPNLAGFLLSIIISMVIVGLIDFMLKEHKLSPLGYSLVRFFAATFVNATLVFLTMFTITFLKSGEFITFQNAIAIFLFYPFLLYAGFFFNLTCSKFAFASKDEYLENNPYISTGMIKITKIITFSIFVLSFLPIMVISIEYILGLFG